ncbi:hypothetical protein [Arthrobacter sp. V1I7]|nr:hypothetical protein [Arthrobacter sp. V1I7]
MPRSHVTSTWEGQPPLLTDEVYYIPGVREGRGAIHIRLQQGMVDFFK